MMTATMMININTIIISSSSSSSLPVSSSTSSSTSSSSSSWPGRHGNDSNDGMSYPNVLLQFISYVVFYRSSGSSLTHELVGMPGTVSMLRLNPYSLNRPPVCWKMDGLTTQEPQRQRVQVRLGYCRVYGLCWSCWDLGFGVQGSRGSGRRGREGFTVRAYSAGFVVCGWFTT